MATYDSFDGHFRFFADSLSNSIERLGKKDTKAFLAHQKMQVETLVKTENKLRRILSKGKFGKTVYKKFIKFICEDKKNILYARPFFRERQKIFTSKIAKALKKGDIGALQKFHFNYQFIKFLVESRNWAKSSEVLRIVKEIEQLREDLVVLNMPLAISRARIFYSRTPPSQLSYMDLIQIAAEGLISAIDKFVLPFSKVFRAVAIGRITGNFISDYSQTLIHFFPKYKKILYRYNKAVGRMGANAPLSDLTANINEGLTKKQRTTQAEVADLAAAASTVSADTTVAVDPDIAESISRFAAPESGRPDIIVENEDAMNSFKAAIKNLSLLERKALALKGVTG